MNSVGQQTNKLVLMQVVPLGSLGHGQPPMVHILNSGLKASARRCILTIREHLTLVRVIVAAAAVTAVIAAPSFAASAYARYYVDQLFIGNTLESHGAYYQGHKVAVDNAYCLGLRRYGVRTSEYGLDKFWRFKCTMDGADGHAYEAQVSVTHGPKPSYVYWHFLTMRQLY